MQAYVKNPNDNTLWLEVESNDSLENVETQVQGKMLFLFVFLFLPPNRLQR